MTYEPRRGAAQDIEGNVSYGLRLFLIVGGAWLATVLTAIVFVLGTLI